MESTPTATRATYHPLRDSAGLQACGSALLPMTTRVHINDQVFRHVTRGDVTLSRDPVSGDAVMSQWLRH